jgi:hypothetical protein
MGLGMGYTLQSNSVDNRIRGLKCQTATLFARGERCDIRGSCWLATIMIFGVSPSCNSEEPYITKCKGHLSNVIIGLPGIRSWFAVVGVDLGNWVLGLGFDVAPAEVFINLGPFYSAIEREVAESADHGRAGRDLGGPLGLTGLSKRKSGDG